MITTGGQRPDANHRCRVRNLRLCVQMKPMEHDRHGDQHHDQPARSHPFRDRAGEPRQQNRPRTTDCATEEHLGHGMHAEQQPREAEQRGGADRSQNGEAGPNPRTTSTERDQASGHHRRGGGMTARRAQVHRRQRGPAGDKHQLQNENDCERTAGYEQPSERATPPPEITERHRKGCKERQDYRLIGEIRKKAHGPHYSRPPPDGRSRIAVPGE